MKRNLIKVCIVISTVLPFLMQDVAAGNDDVTPATEGGNGGAIVGGLIQKTYLETIRPALYFESNATVLKPQEISNLAQVISDGTISIRMVIPGSLKQDSQRFLNLDGSPASIYEDNLMDSDGQVVDCRVVLDSRNQNKPVIQFNLKTWITQTKNGTFFPEDRLRDIAHELFRYAHVKNAAVRDDEDFNVTRQLTFTNKETGSGSLDYIVPGTYGDITLEHDDALGPGLRINEYYINYIPIKLCSPLIVRLTEKKNHLNNRYFSGKSNLCIGNDKIYPITIEVYQKSLTELLVRTNQPTRVWTLHNIATDLDRYDWVETSYLSSCSGGYASYPPLSEIVNCFKKVYDVAEKNTYEPLKRNMWRLHGLMLEHDRASIAEAKSLLDENPKIAVAKDFLGTLPIYHTASTLNIDMLEKLATLMPDSSVDVSQILNILSKQGGRNVGPYLQSFMRLYGENITTARAVEYLIQVTYQGNLTEPFEAFLFSDTAQADWHLAAASYLYRTVIVSKTKAFISIMLKHADRLLPKVYEYFLYFAIAVNDADLLKTVHEKLPISDAMTLSEGLYFPLHEAAKVGSLDVITQLLTVHQLNAQKIDGDKFSALSYAVIRHQYSTAKLLYDAFPKGLYFDFGYGPKVESLVTLSARHAQTDEGWRIFNWLVKDLCLQPDYMANSSDGKHKYGALDILASRLHRTKNKELIPYLEQAILVLRKQGVTRTAKPEYYY